MKTKVIVNDKMQKNYIYYRIEPFGQNFHHEFAPDLTPNEMLKLGVFGGKYMTDCKDEFPMELYEDAKLSPTKDKNVNFFKVNASRSLSYWEEKGWIYQEDPRGWFQWYCRYYYGRRSSDDLRQIKRWKAMRRHIAQLTKNCPKGAILCRPRQRQALLHWAYDSRIL